MKKNFFDTYIGAALEYDIFAGGDPNRPKSDRYTSKAAATADQSAIAEKEAVDAGLSPNQTGAQENPNTPEATNSEDPTTMGDPAGGDSSGGDMSQEDPSMSGGEDMGIDDGTGVDNGEDPSMGGEDLSSTDQGSTTDPNAQLEKKRKETMFEVTTSLHGAISNNIEMLRKINPPIDENANKIYYDIINQLQHCKDTLYRIALNDIQSGDYVDILRRITAISKVYELSIETIKLIYPKIKEKT